VHTLVYGQLNAYDVLCADDVVFTRGALAAFLESPVVTKVTAKVNTEEAQ
jgi:large subunit ribosomal protein L4